LIAFLKEFQEILETGGDDLIAFLNAFQGIFGTVVGVVASH